MSFLNFIFLNLIIKENNNLGIFIFEKNAYIGELFSQIRFFSQRQLLQFPFNCFLDV